MANAKTIEIILKTIGDFSDVTSNISTVQKSLNQLKLPTDLKTKFTGIFADLEKETNKYQKHLASGFKTKGDVTGLEKTGNRIKSLFESLHSTMQKINPDILKNSFNFDTSELDDLNKKIEQTREKIQSIVKEKGMEQAFSGVEKAVEKLNGLSKSKSIENFLGSFKAGNIDAARIALQKLSKNADNFKDAGKKQEFEAWLKPLEDGLNKLAENTVLQQKRQELSELLLKAGNLEASQIKSFFDAFEQGKLTVGNMTNEWDEFKSGADSSARSVFDLGTQMDQLKSRIGHFFGISNVFNLFKRTIREAINTVKELDAVMTETAVVTDFTVGDMWEKLPEYTSEANALGASIRDLYAATTLYYQQGLQTEAAMGVGIETMKMARIAGMDAANATEAMTAALRGFNMEVNETNAVRVNDVYSELAAITAADTEQIATAMSKTASIAASANMEFETTAALLAQIIETTQEAPETAGTAMKTIIARFAEVKKLRDEGMGSGEDEEGEIIDVNKIQAALRTVGISMNDFFAGKEGLDSILLKLAEKWNTLDFETQRYIATTAAGSRQQSRFIAMMSDYQRTMELATAANNSAGASQEQFDKTLESMEAKLQKLNNAWNEFTMGLANNEILKFGVDFLTQFLTTINNTTSALSGGNGLIKSIVNLITVIGALKGGATIAKTIFEGSGKTGGLISSIIGKDSSKKAEAQGQKDGVAYSNGFKRAIQANKTGKNIGQQFGALIGKETVVSIGKVTEEELDNSIKSLKKRYQATQITDKNTGKVIARGYKYRDLTEQEAGELKNTLKDYDAGKVTYEEADAACKKYGATLEQLRGQVKATALDVTSLGMAAMGVGTAFSLLGGLADKLGLEGLGKVLKSIGSALIGVGSVAMMLGPILNKLGVEFTKLGIAINGSMAVPMAALAPIILGVVAAVGLLVGMFIAIRNASPDYQLKKASEAADEAAEAADKAAESYNNLKSSLESIEQKENALDGLIAGTNEWKDAVSELNNQILDLLALYPELAPFISTENGVLTISTEGEEFITNKERQNKANAEALNIGEQIDKVIAQKVVDYNNLDRRLVQYEWETTYATDGYGNQYIADVRQVENKELTEELAKGLASGIIARDDERLAFLDSYEGAYEDFLAFGRALLTSDQAVGVFTESLLTAATANADVSEEFKAQIGGMYTEEMISKLIDEYETSSGLPTNEDMLQYAAMKGYTYEGGNKFKDTEGKTKRIGLQEIKEQLAPVKAQQEMIEAITKMEYILNNLKKSSNGLEKAFANVISKADGAGITLEDFSNNKDLFTTSFQEALNDDGGFKNEELNQLYSKVSDTFTQEQFYQIFADSYKKIGESIEGAREKMFSMGLGEELFSNAKLEAGALVGITEQLYEVFLFSGRKASNAMANMLSDSFDKIEGQDQQRIFAEALEMIDWSSIDSVNDLSEILLDLGFDADAAGIDIGLLEEEIKLAAKASRTFNLEKIREEIKSADELVKDLRGREETERTITAEQKDLILAADPSLEDKFVASGIDEFVYVGDSISDLIVALNNNTAAQLGDYGAQLENENAKAERWQEIYESGRVWQYEDGRRIGTDYQVLADIAQKGSLEGYNLEAVKDLMEQLEIDAVGTTEQLVARIKQEYENYGSAAAREKIFADYENYNNTEEQIKLSKLENAQDILDAEGLEENKDKVLQSKLEIEGLVKEYESVEKALAGSNSALAENKMLMKAAIIDSKAYENNLSKLAEVYKDNRDVLKETNKDTVTYQRALAEVTTAAQQAFGEGISEDFVSNNLPLFDQWYQGVEGAAEKIREALINSLADSLTGTEEEVAGQLEAIKSAVAGLDGLEFDVYGHADATEIFDTLANVLGSADEAKRALASLGYSVELVKAPVYDYTHGPNGILVGYEYRAIVTDGLGNSISTNRSNYSGGGGGKQKWDNKYDKSYNKNEQLNEELRNREKLERAYQRLLDGTNTKTSELVENARAQVASLQAEKKLREQILSSRYKEMAEVEKEYKDLSDYASYNEESRVIEINWEKINKLDNSTNEKLTSRIEEYISKLEQAQSNIDEQTDALEEINDNVQKIYDQGKEEYFNLEQQIRDAIQDARQKEIDELVNINEAINESNTSLIDALQTTIDKQRQDRENEKTEQSLADKQRRLIYLQQDTSGANNLEILRLQKEIEEEQQEYTDSLIDQKINELQQQNDIAAEQRQYQIDLMQTQLDQYLQSNQLWQDVYNLMANGIGKDGIIAGSDLDEILRQGASFEAMSELGQMKWLEELENNVAKAIEWLMMGNSTSSLKNKGELQKGDKVTFTTADGKKVTGKVNSKGQVVADGQIYEGVYRNYDGSYVTNENYKKKKKEEPAPAPDTETDTSAKEKTYPYGKASETTGDIKKGSTGKKVKAIQWALQELGYNIGSSGVDGEFGNDTAAAVKKFQKDTGLTVDGIVGDKTRKKFKAKEYKTGGLADFTGPAWLDGTKSRPEYVLNATQTKSFFELVDVLEDLKHTPARNSEKNGDITYDIDINVESISNDYDVEQMADKIKSLINDSARYRNNNTISSMR